MIRSQAICSATVMCTPKWQGRICTQNRSSILEPCPKVLGLDRFRPASLNFCLLPRPNWYPSENKMEREKKQVVAVWWPKELAIIITWGQFESSLPWFSHREKKASSSIVYLVVIPSEKNPTRSSSFPNLSRYPPASLLLILETFRSCEDPLSRDSRSRLRSTHRQTHLFLIHCRSLPAFFFFVH